MNGSLLSPSCVEDAIMTKSSEGNFKSNSIISLMKHHHGCSAQCLPISVLQTLEELGIQAPCSSKKSSTKSSVWRRFSIRKQSGPRSIKKLSKRYERRALGFLHF